jgi:hypothetical protein
MVTKLLIRILKLDLRLICITDFPKLAKKLLVIRTDSHENLVRPKNILPVRKKSPKKFIMFNLAFFRVIYPSISNWAPDFTSGFYRG